MKAEKSKAESEAEKLNEKTEEYRQMQSLFISLTYLAGAVLLSLGLTIGGFIFFAMSSLIGGLSWASLVVACIGLSGLIGIYTWALAKRREP